MSAPRDLIDEPNLVAYQCLTCGAWWRKHGSIGCTGRDGRGCGGVLAGPVLVQVSVGPYRRPGEVW